MAPIPLSNRTKSPQVVRQPRGDVGGAGRGWNAVAQAGQVLGQVGSQIAQSNAKKKNLNNRLAEEQDKADTARVSNTLDNNWASAQDSMKLMTDPVEISDFDVEWRKQQKTLMESSNLTEAAKINIKTKWLDMEQTSNRLVAGPNGFMNQANIKNLDGVWINQEQDALNTGNADKYIEAVEARGALGTMTPDQIAKGKTKFGQTTYYRQSYGSLDIDFEPTVANTDTTKMSTEQAAQWNTHKLEVANRIENSITTLTDETFLLSTREASNRELTTATIDKLAREDVEVYAGVTTKAITRAQAGVLKATVSGQISVDKSTYQYKAVLNSIEKSLKKGDLNGESMDRALTLMMDANGDPLFSTQSNLALMNEINSVWRVGRKFNPAGFKRAIPVSDLQGQALSDVLKSFEYQSSIQQVDSQEEFKAVQARVSSLMNLFSEKGDRLSEGDYSTWRKEEMRGFDLMVAEDNQRRLAGMFPRIAEAHSKNPSNKEVVQIHNGRQAVFNSETREFIRWQ